MKLGDAALKKIIKPKRLPNARSFCRVLGLKMEAFSRCNVVESDMGDGLYFRCGV